MENANRYHDSDAGRFQGEALDMSSKPDARDVHHSVSFPACLSRYEFSGGRGVTGFVQEPRAASFVVREMVLVDSTETTPGVEKETLIHHDHMRYYYYYGEDDDVDEDGVEQYFDAETFTEMKPIEEGDHEFEFEGLEVHEEDKEEEEERLSLCLQDARLESQQGRFIRQAGSEDDEDLDKEDDRDVSRVSPDCKEEEALMQRDSSPVTDHPNQSEDDDYIELELQEQRGDDDEDEEQGKPGLGGSEELGATEEPCWSTNETDTDTGTESDSLWEHEDIVEQLKLELRNVRTGGLTTIPEESETEYEMATNMGGGRGGGGLKQMKMEENKDRIGEIQKVYKNYSERMRKLDILSYQTFHAIGKNKIKF